MNYIRVQWLHARSDEPVWMISELDADRWETRKIEIFADGSKGYARQGEEAGGTVLGQLPVPALHEIAADPQFLPEEITKKEFEAIWEARQTNPRPGLIRQI
jgi:hypothetical protein